MSPFPSPPMSPDLPPVGSSSLIRHRSMPDPSSAACSSSVRNQSSLKTAVKEVVHVGSTTMRGRPRRIRGRWASPRRSLPNPPSFGWIQRTTNVTMRGRRGAEIRCVWKATELSCRCQGASSSRWIHPHPRTHRAPSTDPTLRALPTATMSVALAPRVPRGRGRGSTDQKERE